LQIVEALVNVQRLSESQNNLPMALVRPGYKRPFQELHLVDDPPGISGEWAGLCYVAKIHLPVFWKVVVSAPGVAACDVQTFKV
jgi:hypothetical protein